MFSDILKSSMAKMGLDQEMLLRREQEGGVSLKGTPEDAAILKRKGLNNLFKYFTIYIRNEEDFENLHSNFKSIKNIKNQIIISKYILSNKGIPPNKYDIEIYDINDFTMPQLKFLSNKGGKLGKIHLHGFNCDSTYVFNINEFINIKNSVNYITRNIDVEKSDIEKFLEVYEILGKNIESTKGAGLHEAIFQKKAACFGYSQLLNLVLNNVGINSISINGSYKKEDHPKHEGHAWNQVKIDDIWYNCDLTWDSDEIKKKRTIMYCLRSDAFFLRKDEHIPPLENLIRYNVACDYSQSKIQKYFSRDIEMER